MSTGQALALLPGTLVVLMGAARLGAVAAALIAAGKDPATPVSVTQSGTTAAQRSASGTLATIAAEVEAAGIGSPAVTVIGAVAALRDELAWAERRPLHGRRIVVTRARAQASGLVARLRDLGAEVDECAVIRIEPIAGPPIDAGAYTLVCVTSPNAPKLLLERCGGDARALAGVVVAAIGPGTAAALREVGLVADVVAERSLAEGLLEALPSDLRGARALVARAEEARDTLPEGLRAAGADVDGGAALSHARQPAPAPRAHARRRCRGVHVVLDRHALRRGARRSRPRGCARRLDRPRDERDGARSRGGADRGSGAARPGRSGRGAAPALPGISGNLTHFPLAQTPDPPLG